MKYEFLYSLYTRIGCDRISQRAAQGSLYRGAGRQRRSERLKVVPYECPEWGYFCGLLPATSELRLFHESVAAKPHLIPRKSEQKRGPRTKFSTIVRDPFLYSTEFVVCKESL